MIFFRVYRDLFPETLYMLFIINASWNWRLVWNILKVFISGKTVGKIRVLGKDYMKELLRYIDIDQIPSEYKGEGRMKIKYGHCCDVGNNCYS